MPTNELKTTTHTHSHPTLGPLTGLIHLHHSRSLCISYTSIPYALPPTGHRRWRQPQPISIPLSHTQRPLDCTAPTPLCFQPAPPGNKPHPDPSSLSEDCLKLDIWTPAGPAPKGGWPILFFIHGGWLQIGSPRAIEPIALLGSGRFRGIIAAPAYRLNVFGFLAGAPLSEGNGAFGNYGFWDQRLALEFVVAHVAGFGGDKERLTIAGYSAGAHSCFYQLAHELVILPPRKRVIRKVVMFSNGPGPQPKSPSTAQKQFAFFCSKLGLDPRHSSVMDKLRNISADKLSAAATSMDALHEFCAITDGSFVHPQTFTHTMQGELGRRMIESGIQLLTGECRDERTLYGRWHPLASSSYNALQTRLEADYPPYVVAAVLREHYALGQLLPRKETLQSPDGRSPKDWHEAFGAIYADLQVHALERGLLRGVERAAGSRRAGEFVKRYRIEWRAAVVDKVFGPEMGVTHTTDMPIWFWGNGLGERAGGLEGQDARVAERFAAPVWKWVEGAEWKDVDWGTRSIREVRVLNAHGEVTARRDEDWKRGGRVCDIIDRAQQHAEETKSKL